MRLPRTLRASVLIGSVAAWSVGCTEDAVEDAWVSLGSGEVDFEPIADEQSVPLVAGLQGAFHIWVSFRCRGLDPVDLMLTMELGRLDGAPPVDRTRREISMEEDPEAKLSGATHALVGWPAVVSRPGCALDRAILVRLELTDRAGREVADERIVIPRWESPAVAPRCPEL